MPLNYTNQTTSTSLKGKTIAFCLPGLMYSGTFMTQFVRLLFDLNQQGSTAQSYANTYNCTNALGCTVAVTQGN